MALRETAGGQRVLQRGIGNFTWCCGRFLKRLVIKEKKIDFFTSLASYLGWEPLLSQLLWESTMISKNQEGSCHIGYKHHILMSPEL